MSVIWLMVMIRFFITAFLFSISFIACQDQPTSVNGLESPLAKSLHGEWRAKSMRVVLNSVNNTPHIVIFDVDETNWMEKLRLNPYLIDYAADGSYTFTYPDTTGNSKFNIEGKWDIINDSVYRYQLKPDMKTMSYKVTIKGDVAEYFGTLDFDNDGKADDDYYGVEVREK